VAQGVTLRDGVRVPERLVVAQKDAAGEGVRLTVVDWVGLEAKEAEEDAHAVELLLARVEAVMETLLVSQDVEEAEKLLVTVEVIVAEEVTDAVVLSEALIQPDKDTLTVAERLYEPQGEGLLDKEGEPELEGERVAAREVVTEMVCEAVAPCDAEFVELSEAEGLPDEQTDGRALLEALPERVGDTLLVGEDEPLVDGVFVAHCVVDTVSRCVCDTEAVPVKAVEPEQDADALPDCEAMVGVAAALKEEFTPPIEDVALPDAVLAIPVEDLTTLAVTEMVEVTDVEGHGEAELHMEGVLAMEGVAAVLPVELTPPKAEDVALPDAELAICV
jgi:hypothetical protein